MCHNQANETLQLSRPQLWWHIINKFILLTLPILLSRCTQLGPSFSRLITRSSLCCSISSSNPHFWRSLYYFSLISQDIGLKMIELCPWMNLIDGDQRTQLHGFVLVVSILYPTQLRPIEDLVYNGPRGKASNDSAVLTPPPGRFVFDARGRASNDPPPGLWVCCQCPVG